MGCLGTLGIIAMVMVIIELILENSQYIFSVGLLFALGIWLTNKIVKKGNSNFAWQRRLAKLEAEYYPSVDFLELKKNIATHVDNCNQFNEHISQLRKIHIGDNQLNYGKANYHDASIHNYTRPEFKKLSSYSYVYQCSREICDSARKQPFKYICKYFRITPNEKTLEQFEDLLNNLEAAKEGVDLLNREKQSILSQIQDQIPSLIRQHGYDRFQRELGFRNINLQKIEYPQYSFQYISSGGYAETRCDITLDIDNLNKFINYLSDVITFRKSVAGQRALMTSSLRKKILSRDHYKCQMCGISKHDEKHLLLEVDHKFPVSRGGLTTEENLWTLCWRCNREKGSKILPEFQADKEKADDYNVRMSSPIAGAPSTNISYGFDEHVESIKLNEASAVYFPDNNKVVLKSVSKEHLLEKKEATKSVFDPEKGIYPPGQYIIGEDIPPGKYLLKAKSEKTGSVTIYESYKEYRKDEMIEFKSFEDDYFIALREKGYFIDIEDADVQRL